MEIEIKIGREVEGNGALLVPPTCKKVGRRHATLYWKDGTVTIEDNESANGTFVNGKRIAKAKIGENDVVWLGGTNGAECYQVDLKKVFTSCREAEKKARTDYSKEFEKLKQAYLDYQAEVTELKKKSSMETQLPMKILTFIPALIGLVLFFVLKGEYKEWRLLPTMIGSVVSGLISIFTFGKSASSGEKLNESMMDLQIKYQPRYCCPKCGMKYPFTTHWKKLEADGKCPNPKCNAEFVKKK
jgi:hypothetical protein